MNLWDFDTEIFENIKYNSPDSILMKQADSLSKNTHGYLYGTLTNMKFEPLDDTVQYNLAIMFEVVVPNLDNYRYTLLTLYSRPESDYPVAISVCSDTITDAKNFGNLYEYWNRKEFVNALKSILCSNKVNKVLKLFLPRKLLVDMLK